LGERWNILIVREALMGSTRFSEFQAGIPAVSRTMLSTRLKTLVDAGVLVKSTGEGGPTYALTASGRELFDVVKALGVWGQRWIDRGARDVQSTFDEVLWDMRRRVDRDALPQSPVVLRIRWTEGGERGVRCMLLRREEVSFCSHNMGFPEVQLDVTPSTLARWWRGDTDLARSGLVLSGEPEHRRAFPTWFHRYLFADVRPAAQ